MPAPDYHPTKAHTNKTLKVKTTTLSLYRCPQCEYTCRPQDLHPLIKTACPRCFRAIIHKMVPQMVPTKVTMPVDDPGTGLEPKPGTIPASRLNRGDEMAIPTVKMKAKVVIRRRRRH